MNIETRKVLDYITLQLERVDNEIYDCEESGQSKFCYQHLLVWRESLSKEFERILDGDYLGYYGGEL
jgi:hypothetical protein